MVKTIKIIIGANYGDEGKGLATHQFAMDAAKKGQSCLNVLYNGGCQRGHTVETAEGQRHVFHHFGAGTLNGAVSYLHDDFIVNPMEYMRELRELEHIGITPICFISPQCRVTTPYDMLINRIVEEARGKDRHGSCGMGIWETVERYRNRTNDLNIVRLSFFTDDELRAWLSIIREKYLPKRLEHYNISEIPKKYKEIIESETLAENYISDLKAMINHGHVELSIPTLRTFIHQHDYIIFEGGQGLALSQDNEEEYPNVTASDTGSLVPLNTLKYIMLGDVDIEIMYVTRSYFTRHGAGKLPNEISINAINIAITDKTNQDNEFQGSLRYAMYDGLALNKRVRNDAELSKLSPYKDSIKHSLLITHMNETNYMIFGRWANDYLFNNIYVSDRKDGFII